VLLRLAPDLVKLLEASKAAVDPNLLELVPLAQRLLEKGNERDENADDMEENTEEKGEDDAEIQGEHDENGNVPGGEEAEETAQQAERIAGQVETRDGDEDTDDGDSNGNGNGNDGNHNGKEGKPTQADKQTTVDKAETVVEDEAWRLQCEEFLIAQEGLADDGDLGPVEIQAGNRPSSSKVQKRKAAGELGGSSWGVGDQVTVGGRIGVVLRDMRPKYDRATLRWEDTGEEQKRIDAEQIKIIRTNPPEKVSKK